MTTCEPAVTAVRKDALEHQDARWLTHRVDAFYLKFKGPLRDDVRAELVALQAKMISTKAEAAVNVERGGGELRGAMSTRSREGWWSINSAWCSVVIDEHAREGWSLKVNASALLLMREGPHAALTMARSIARAMLSQVVEERVSRLDLCADVTGFDLGGLNVQHFVTHKRVRFSQISQLQEYWRAGKRTGFVFGKGDAMARIYDKTEHLALGLDDTKADEERSEWSCAGWNGRDDVTRVEFQLRGRLLKELELRDPDRCLERLDSIWSYCTHKWLRFVDRSTATRKERCETDQRWAVLEEVVFRVRTEPAKRVRAPSVPHARRMVSAIVNFSACEGLLALFVGDPRERVANWSNARAEAWIQEQLFTMSRTTSRAAAADLIGRFDDACDAAVHLMEKQGAASAKFNHVPIRKCDDAAVVAA